MGTSKGAALLTGVTGQYVAYPVGFYQNVDGEYSGVSEGLFRENLALKSAGYHAGCYVLECQLNELHQLSEIFQQIQSTHILNLATAQTLAS